LLKKKNDSAMATSMELLQQGERFRIIDPPSLPVKPSFPDRLKFCAIGLIVGLALGAACVWLAEMMDDRVYSEMQLRKLLPVSILSELPLISGPTDERERQHRDLIGWATTAGVITVILAGSAMSYWKG
jgi:succinoglycan biosynthesis transport protein ExoP